MAEHRALHLVGTFSAPILDVRPAGEGARRDGSKLTIPPPVALTQRGRIVQVSVSVGQQIAGPIAQAGGVLQVTHARRSAESAAIS